MGNRSLKEGKEINFGLESPMKELKVRMGGKI